MAIQLDVFSGFLGSGKTTLIKKLIEERIYNAKAVIIENEFGEVSVDGKILKDSNLNVKELSSGCICCSLSGDFKKAIQEVIEKYSPERIIIEPSGVGKLSDILKVVKESELRSVINLNMLITIVDGLKFHLYLANFGDFYKNQIANCKTVIISRSQMLSEKKLIEISKEIVKINASANIVTTPWDKLSGSNIVDAAEQRDIILNKVNIIKKPQNIGVLRKESAGSARDVFDSWGFESPRIFNRSTLEKILPRLENTIFGNVVRAKGIVKTGQDTWIQFDYVPGEFEVKATSPDYATRICVIGTELNKGSLSQLFSD